MDKISEMFTHELMYSVIESSFVRKKNIALDRYYIGRPELEQLHKYCRCYACESIVGSLMSFKDARPGQIYHLYCDREHFYILARVRTNWEQKTIEETAEDRKFLSFTVLTENNLSHFPGRVLYGYYTGITPSMIIVAN